MSAHDPRLDAIVAYFESLSPNTLARLETIYREDASFKDPFNDVQGIEAIRRVYAHMFQSLQQPRFVVTQRFAQGTECMLLWDFRFHSRGLRHPDQCIRGASHLTLADDGRIARHRDYWDAAEELYEQVPWLGGFMRWLKRRAAS